MKKWLLESAIVLAVFAIASWWGADYSRVSQAAGRRPFFYQSTFEPAVMIACGRGFSVAASPRPALTPFLETAVDQFSCADLPGDLVVTRASGQPALAKHLLYAVGSFWRIEGITWSGLAAFAGMVFAASVCTAYALFRLAMNRVLALVGTAIFAVSPLQLLNLPSLTDYSKTPFMLGLVCLTALAVLREYSTRALVLVGAAFGTVLGIGYGVRSDVIVLLPPFVLAILILAPGNLRLTIRSRLLALGTAIVMFVVVAFPLLQQRSQSGSCQGHVTILGMMSDFTSALGIVPPLYDIGHLYHDMFAYETATAFAHRASAGLGAIDYCSPEHDAAAAAFLGTVATRMPADLLIRAYASMRKIPELPFGWPAPPLPDWHARLYDVRAAVVNALQETGLAWVTGAVILATLASVRAGVLALFLALYLGAFPAVQFANRHHFFLEFVTIWAVLFVVSCAWLAARRRAQLRGWLDQRRLVVATGLPIVTVVLMSMTLLMARAYQERTLTRLFESYLSAPRVSLDAVEQQFAEPPRLGTGQPAALLVATVDPAACDGTIRVTWQYDDTHPDERFFTRSVAISQDARGPVHVFAPAYRGFRRVVIEPATAGCAAAVSRVDHPDPLWLYAVLDASWRRAPLYQRLTSVFAPYHVTDGR